MICTCHSMLSDESALRSKMIMARKYHILKITSVAFNGIDKLESYVGRIILQVDVFQTRIKISQTSNEHNLPNPYRDYRDNM
jgi:hypothetical protein